MSASLPKKVPVKVAQKIAPPKTDTTPYHGHGKLYAGGFAAAVLLFFAATMLVWNGRVPGWEASLFQAINDLPEGWYHFFLAASLFHDSMWMAALVVAAAFAFRFYRLSWRLAFCSVLGYAVCTVARHIIDRPRPTGLLEHMHARTFELGMAFPSAHVMIMSIAAMAVLPYLPWRWRWLISIPILLMAVSRIYLGVQMPLDAIGGIALGVGVISLVRILPQPLKVFLRLD